MAPSPYQKYPYRSKHRLYVKTRKVYGIPALDKTQPPMDYPNPDQARPSPVKKPDNLLPPLSKRVGKYSWSTNDYQPERPSRYQHVREAPRVVHDRPGLVVYQFFIKGLVIPLIALFLISLLLAAVGAASNFPNKPHTEAEYLQHVRAENTIDNLSNQQIVSIGKKTCQRLTNKETLTDVLASTKSLEQPLRSEAIAAIQEGVKFYCPGRS